MVNASFILKYFFVELKSKAVFQVAAPVLGSGCRDGELCPVRLAACVVPGSYAVLQLPGSPCLLLLCWQWLAWFQHWAVRLFCCLPTAWCSGRVSLVPGAWPGSQRVPKWDVSATRLLFSLNFLLLITVLYQYSWDLKCSLGWLSHGLKADRSTAKVHGWGERVSFSAFTSCPHQWSVRKTQSRSLVLSPRQTISKRDRNGDTPHSSQEITN